MNRDRKALPAGMPIELLAQHIFTPDENDIDLEKLGGLQCPAYFGAGRVIAAHCVKSYGHHGVIVMS